ncbi:O-antigen polymerase [Lactobacillus intestinalis]|uniref:Oligosaccharide repeat unit polymerase n=1 Tax=Lactobacillus intestinalis DSM 6629 TaxID=1423761 RepID=A0ABR5PPP1_9LACO|nr:O-antigen polymerase [Lactobacillus intestinalis]KRM31308.1 hypothetical protein FC44_GL000543 [Lactobacillus intestinalis DSM 6629]UTW40136.1 oligosaccharide repeat unit polymerase [Lactobacillus intestinalis]
MLILLFLIFILLLFITYYLFDKDYMAPPFLFCAVYIISIGSALINYTQWGLQDYSITPFLILLGGALIFIFVGYLIKKLVCNQIPDNYDRVLASSRININIGISFFLVILNLWILYLTFKSVKAIGGNGSLSQVIEAYRAITSYGTDTSMSIPGYIQQLQKIPTICAYIYPFVLIFNIVKSYVNKKDWLFSIANVLIFVLMSMILSNRLNILGMVGTIIIYYFVLKQSPSNNQNVKSLFKLLGIFVGLMIFFYSIRLLVGRSNSADSSFMDYITMYVGGPVKLFDMFIKNPIHDASIWGKETFISMIGTVRDLGGNIPVYLQHKEFRTYNGIQLGNVYSAYRNWLADFGISGVIILQTLFAIFYNYYYYLLQRRNIIKHKLAFIIYGYMAEGIFLHPIDDWLFSIYLSVGMIIYLILFFVLYNLITRKVKF